MMLSDTTARLVRVGMTTYVPDKVLEWTASNSRIMKDVRQHNLLVKGKNALILVHSADRKLLPVKLDVSSWKLDSV